MVFEPKVTNKLILAGTSKFSIPKSSACASTNLDLSVPRGQTCVNAGSLGKHSPEILFLSPYITWQFFTVHC
jgi:hypothetical protein